MHFVQNILANPPLLTAIVIALVVWTLPWKAVALWKAAKLSQKWWFVIMLVVNTVGILEILYIFVFSKMAGKAAPQEGAN